jgi:cleavage and polyadenylation specificity factor subunit 2
MYQQVEDPVKQALIKEEEDEEMIEAEKPPVKTLAEVLEVELRCKVHMIDFEGRSDSRSIPKLVASLKPRRVVLVRGTAEAKETLSASIKRACKDELLPVAAPLKGQCVGLTDEDSTVFRLSLKDSLVQGLRFVQVGDHEVSYVEGQIKIDYGDSSLPLLRACPTPLQKGHPAVLLGNLKFIDLKTVLSRHGIRADIVRTEQGHVIVCGGGAVQIHRGQHSHQISINGCLCDEYFKCREVLYGLYEII